MSLAVAAILVVAAAVLAALVTPPLLRARRRKRAFTEPLSEALRAVIARRVPVANVLPSALAQQLEGLVVAFLREKQFIGCNGLEIDDEIRGTIAAQACLLVLGRPGSLYDELQSILVYPGAFWVEDEVQEDDGLVTRRRRELSGEAWDSHRIILSWEDVEEGAARPGEGYNVVLHEFAHYLDAEGRGLAPPPPPVPLPPPRERSTAGRVRVPRERTSTLRARTAHWHRAMQSEYATFRAAVERGDETFLDPYAAEDESEFFAVVTEDFIECGAMLREAHPTLYALMREFYGIDTAAWTQRGSSHG